MTTCPRCDDPACDVPAAHAACDAVARPPVTPGENGCDCYGEFARGHNPARGCKVHGGSYTPAQQAALERLGQAQRACAQRPAVDWRARYDELRLVTFGPEDWAAAMDARIAVERFLAVMAEDPAYITAGNWAKRTARSLALLDRITETTSSRGGGPFWKTLGELADLIDSIPPFQESRNGLRAVFLKANHLINLYRGR